MEYKIKLYKDLIIKNNHKSKDILFLVSNNKKALDYKNSIDLNYSEELRVTTYISFIKSEIKKYWPIIIDEIKKIDVNSISPIFLNTNLMDFMINEKVSKKRNYEGFFKNITSSDKNIAINIGNNIRKSGESLINVNEIGDKIYNSKENRSNIDYLVYENMNEIIIDYLNNIIKKGILDDSTSIYIYNELLLKNDIYINKIKNEIKYIIVDALEKTKTCEIDFIKSINGFCKEVYVFFDKSKDYSIFNNVDLDYIKDSLKDENIRYFICDNETDNIDIENISIQDIYLLNKKIILDDESQFYNEMIKKCCEKVLSVISEGYLPKDIAILIPNNNDIVEMLIKTELEDKIDVYNIKSIKLTDNNYLNCIYVSLCIFFGMEKFITYGNYINFIEVLFEVNKIKARTILNCYEKELKDIISYIKSHKDIEVYEFLNKFYTEKMLHLKYSKENISLCKKLIDEVEKFISIVDENYEELLLKYIKDFIFDFSTNIKNINSVFISSPVSYLNNELNSKVQIWLDISSDLWINKIDKEISNFISLRKSFNNIYTSKMENNYQNYYTNNLVYSLLEKANRVYMYKSEYSINGYVQDSYFSRYIEDLVDLGGI